MMIRPSGSAGERVAYAAGRFAESGDAFIIYQAGGVSPFGGVLASFGSDYTVEVRPDGFSRSRFGGMDVTAPAGFGKAWYIKDQESGALWSAFLHPVCEKANEYEIRYSPGQVSAYTLKNKIASTLTVATVPDYPCELWYVKLENRSARDRRISFTTYVEPGIGASLETKYLERDRAILMRRPLGAIEADRTDGAAQDLVLVSSSTLTPTRFQTHKGDFLGDGRTLRNPAHVEDDGSAGSDGATTAPIISLTVEIELPIEGEAEFGFCLGLAGSAERGVELARAFDKAQNIGSTIEASRSQWGELCSNVQVASSDSAFDALVNTWLPYETYVSWANERGEAHIDPSRVADVLRAVYPFAATAPDFCRDCLLSFAAGLTILGTCSAEKGSVVSVPDRELLVMAIAAAGYVAETGDIDILSQSIALGGALDLSVREHCERALRTCITRAESEPDAVDLGLLEHGLRLWTLVCEDSGDLGKHLELIHSRLLAERTGSAEQTALPQRVRYLQSVSHSLSDRLVSQALQSNFPPAEPPPSSTAAAFGTYSLLVESVLGLSATCGGLELRPSLPESWCECAVTRRFRRDTYNIHIKRGSSPSTQGVSIVVDGEPVMGQTLPYFGDDRDHLVEVVIG